MEEAWSSGSNTLSFDTTLPAAEIPFMSSVDNINVLAAKVPSMLFAENPTRPAAEILI